MILFLSGLGVLLAGGLASLAAGRNSRMASLLGAGGTVAGCLLGGLGAAHALSGGPDSLRLAWDIPFGSFYVGIDALSAFFLLPIFGLSALSAVYGAEYLQAWGDRKRLGPPWFFTNLLVASMALVVVSRNGVLFLLAWEAMSLASFFLVTFEDEREDAREAGWTYLLAAHFGTAFLLVLFVLLGNGAGTMDFDRLGAAGEASKGAVFLLAIVGFGTKAGFMPFHVWLPEAHPAAPSHVSAIMSGVMIKTGIYGLVRVLTLLGTPPPWWGWLLVGIGVVSGILGVLFALAQHDLKRLLAYHSVENIGIIALGLGVGILGRACGLPALAALGFAGGLLHVLNHALFKGLLFLGAGAVLHATRTRDLDLLGGLLKKMPVTGLTFLVGAAAISGLPPLNGFVSEFLIYLGSFRGLSGGAAVAIPAMGVIGGLALIGGLAAACFAKAFGIVFLGEPRSDKTAGAHEPGLAMRVPMLLLAAGCAGVALLSPLGIGALEPVIRPLSGGDGGGALGRAADSLKVFLGAAGGLVIVVTGLALLRRALLRNRRVEESVTWDCGYVRPTARMQYTASSFAQPLTSLFGLLLRAHRRGKPPAGLFPSGTGLATETPDVWREGLFRPVFNGVAWLSSKLHWLQTGRVHFYVLYVAVTLLVLLAWKLA